jgi:hypothetical protein
VRLTISLSALTLPFFTSTIQTNLASAPSGHHSLELVSDIILALTALFIAYQGWETRRAADATRDSVKAIKEQAAIMERQTLAAEEAAKAATESTSVLANIERAWVDIRLVRQTGALYTLELTNCGRTVAHVKEIFLSCILTPAKNDVVSAPSWDQNFSQNRLLVPNTPWPARTLDLKELGPATLQQVYTGTVRLHYRLKVRYAGISPDCESECIYYFNSASHYRCLLPVEASEYNRHT